MCWLWYTAYRDTIDQQLTLWLRLTIALERIATALEKAR